MLPSHAAIAHRHVTAGLDDAFPQLLEKVQIDIRRDSLSQEMRDRKMHLKIRAKPDAAHHNGERGSVGDDIVMKEGCIATVVRSRQWVRQHRKGKKRSTQPKIFQPYAGCYVNSTQGPKRDGFAPYWFTIYRSARTHVQAVKDLSIEDTLKCK